MKVIATMQKIAIIDNNIVSKKLLSHQKLPMENKKALIHSNTYPIFLNAINLDIANIASAAHTILGEFNEKTSGLIKHNPNAVIE